LFVPGGNRQAPQAFRTLRKQNKQSPGKRATGALKKKRSASRKNEARKQIRRIVEAE
jgi:hypothetical protein